MHEVWVIDIDSLWITLMGGHVTLRSKSDMSENVVT